MVGWVGWFVGWFVDFLILLVWEFGLGLVVICFGLVWVWGLVRLFLVGFGGVEQL